MAKKKYVFNLLKPIEPPKSSWDKIYKWVVTNARIIIFVSEALIVIAFVSKIAVDNAAKNNLQAFNSVYDNLRFFETSSESDLRKIQNRDINYKRLWNSSNNFTKVIEEVYTYIQNPSSSVTIRIDGNNVVVSGTNNLAELRELEEKFKSSSLFTEATIQALTVEREGVLQETGRFELLGVINKEVTTREQIK